MKRYQVVQNESRSTQTANIMTDGAAKDATKASINCRNAASAGNVQPLDSSQIKIKA